MAEVVEYRIERTITELEQLERYGLLTKDEIKTIIKKRKTYEYRLQRTKRLKEDYLKYIAYEESLLKLVKIRRNKSGFHHKISQIDYTISANIRALYRKVVFKYQFDIQLWLSFINFCKSIKMFAKVSALYSRMLRIHSNNPSVWIMAAKFEFEENNSPETARSLLQRGIRFNAASKLLWHQYFRMELMFCTKLWKRRDILAANVSQTDQNTETNDEVFNGKIASIVYQNAVLAFDDFDFAADFLPICSEFDHRLTQTHKQMIYDDIKLRFNDSEQMWDLLAKRIVIDGNDVIKQMNFDNKSDKKLKKKEFERKAIGLYEEMINKFNNEKMWSFYISYRLEELGKSHKESVIRDKLAKVLDLIERAWDQKCLSTDIFKEWVKLLNSCKDRSDNKLKIQIILQKGCDRWADNIDVWHFSLCLLIKIFDSKSEMKKFFERTLDKFMDKSDESIDKLISICELYLEWSLKSLLPVEINSIANKLTLQSGDSNAKKFNERLKPRILEAYNSAYGIERARHHFQTFKNCPPISLLFYKKMLEIENNNSSPNSQIIRAIHKDIVNNFGSDDASLWIDYIKFEMQNDSNKVSMIYYKAVKQLTPDQCDRFIQEYSLLKSNNFEDDINFEI